MTKKPQIIQAQTFTCNYIEREDRVLLTINYRDVAQRIDFWITRAFLVKLLPYFFEYTAQDSANEQSTDQRDKTQTDNATFALTQQSPILLESIDFRTLQDTKEIIFKSLEHQIFARAVFDDRTFASFVTILIGAVPKFDWGIASI